MRYRPRSSVTTIFAIRVGRSVVSAITQTPASGPLGPRTTPPRSLAPTWIAASCCAALRVGALAKSAGIETAATPKRRLCFIRMLASLAPSRVLHRAERARAYLLSGIEIRRSPKRIARLKHAGLRDRRTRPPAARPRRIMSVLDGTLLILPLRERERA